MKSILICLVALNGYLYADVLFKNCSLTRSLIASKKISDTFNSSGKSQYCTC